MVMFKKILLVFCCITTQAAYGMAYALIEAAKKGETAQVKELINKKVNVNAKDKYSRDGKTALIVAAEHGHKDVVELLLEHGANVNEKDEDGWTALIYAAVNDYKDVVELLLKHGANVKEKNNLGKTALILVAQYDKENIIKILMLFADKDALRALRGFWKNLLDQDMYDLIAWLNDARKNLQNGDAARFAPVVFAMPHFVEKFQTLFKLLDKDYTQIFTADVIQNALLTQNMKAFEILIDQARTDKNNDLLKLIRDEVNHTDKTKFNADFLANLKLLFGTKITGMKKAHNVGFKFESK